MTRSGTGPSSASGCASHSPLLEPDAERAEAPLLQLRSASASDTVSVSGYQRSARSQSRWPPPAADDGDLAAAVQDVEHHGHVARAPPAVRRATRRPSGPPARARAAARARSSSRRTWRRNLRFSARNSRLRRSHAYWPRRRLAIRAADQRQVLDRPDERVPLEELRAPPTAAGRARPGRSRRRAGSRGRDAAAARPSRSVDLEAAEPAHGVEHAGRAAVEQPGRGRRCAAPPRARRPSPPHLARARRRARAGRVPGRAHRRARPTRRTPRSRWKALHDEPPSARSAFRSARPTIRSPPRNGST